MDPKVCLPCCLIVLACLIDPGDGQWKKLRLGELKRDVIALEKLTENLEHEIEVFYDENLLNDQGSHPVVDHHHHNKRKHKSKHTKNAKPDRPPSTSNISAHLDSNNDIISNSDTNLRYFLQKAAPTSATNKVVPKINISDIYWPKFEEILSMNRRKYDWKNDRWIKLQKPPEKSRSEKSDTHKSKHRFNYRRVKLGSGKAKGNVVIAVSAVR